MNRFGFAVSSTLKHIFKGRWINLILVLQIGVLIALASASRSLTLSFSYLEEQVNDYRHQIYFMVGYLPIGRSFQDFTEADYREIVLQNEESLRRGDMLLAVAEASSLLLINEPNQYVGFNDYSAFVYSGDLIPMLAEPLTHVRHDVIYAPDGFLANLRISLELKQDYAEHNGFYIDFVDVENSRLLGASGWIPVRPITELYPEESSVHFNPWFSSMEDETRFSVSKLVLIPSQSGIYRRPEREVKPAAYLAVWMPEQNTQSATSMHRILDYLNSKYRDCNFLPRSYQDVVANERQNVLSLTFMLDLMSVVLGVIVTLGFLGHWLLLMEKRARSIATSVVLGATKTYLFTCCFLEMASILLLGVAIGSCSYGVFAEGYESSFPLRPDTGFLIRAVAFCLVFSAVMSVISTVYFCRQPSTKLLESRKVEL